MTRRATPSQIWVALGSVYLIWGSTYLGLRLMVESIPPLLGGGLRFILAGLLLAVWGLVRGRWRVLPAREWAGAAVVGVLLCGAGTGLVTIAVQEVPSGLAALVVASEPLWVVVLRALMRERMQPALVGGVVLGFVGVALLLLPGHQPAGVSVGPLLLIVLAALAWATGSVAASRIELPSDWLQSAAIQMSCGGLAMIVAGALLGEAASLDVAQVTVRSGAAFAYLVLAGAVVAYSAYAWLLRNAPIAQVTTYAYVNPVVAVFLGWAVLSEPLTGTTTLVGAGLVIASVAVITRGTVIRPPLSASAG
jgi:drug/metabolite transporter (DMT)-like permease